MLILEAAKTRREQPSSSSSPKTNISQGDTREPGLENQDVTCVYAQ